MLDSFEEAEPEEQTCDCFPDWAREFDWVVREGKPEVVKHSLRVRCEDCGEEWAE